MNKVVWFKDLRKTDIAIAGGKGASLGEMYHVGLPVPGGFVISADVYKDFIERTKIKSKIAKLLKGLDVEDSKKLQDTAKKIETLILSTEIPDDIKAVIAENYEKINDFVAVRSSATAEDLPTASFAGQQASFLNMNGTENVIRAVHECWASLFTARAIYYREQNNFEHMKVFISVVVQEMIDAEKAGVIFCINPVTNDDTEAIIEAGYGLGEAVVSGSITPNTYLIDKKSGAIKMKSLHKQEIYYVKDENGETRKKPLPQHLTAKHVLEDDEVKELMKYTKLIENHYKWPQDIEFAIKDSKVYILQARPVTTFKKEGKLVEPDKPGKFRRVEEV